jgi:uncharacterized protein YraI
VIRARPGGGPDRYPREVRRLAAAGLGLGLLAALLAAAPAAWAAAAAATPTPTPSSAPPTPPPTPTSAAPASAPTRTPAPAATATLTPAPTSSPIPSVAPTAPPPTPTVPSPPTPVAPSPLATAQSDLNLRAGPGLGYPVVETVPAGTALAVLGRTAAGDWLQLAVDDATQAWALADLLALDAPSESLAVVDIPAPAAGPAAGPAEESASGPATDTAPGPAGATAPQPLGSVDDNPPRAVGRVLAVGDSVMLGAAATLQRSIPAIDVDAAVSRQVGAAIQVVRARRAAGQLGDAVVLHLGNNGTFTADQFDTLMQLLSDVRRVVVVNLKEDRAWEGPNNAVIADGVGRYPNTVLADWHATSAGRPELFYGDGIHLRPEGARLYTSLINAALSAR